MTDVFISYKSERKLADKHFAEVLHRYGYSVVWYDYSLIKGKDFVEQLEKHIREAKVVIVLWCGSGDHLSLGEGGGSSGAEARHASSC